MKLNKLTSAVSVSLLAVALTACGSDDDAPIIGATPAPTTTPTTPAPAVDNTAKIAEIKANAIAAGLTDANATAFANSAVNLAIGSDAYNAALREALANQNKANSADSNNVVSPVVVDRNFRIPGVDATKQATVTANQYIRQDGSTFDRTANPEQYAGLGAVGTDDPTTQNPYLSNYVLAVETTTNDQGQKVVVATDSTGEMVEKVSAANSDAGQVVSENNSPYATSGGLAYSTDANGAVRSFHYGKAISAPTPAPVSFLNDNKVADNSNGANTVTPVPVLGGTTGNTQIYTIQELNAANVTNNIANDAVAAYNKAKSNVATHVRNTNGTVAVSTATGATAPVLDSGLVVYTNKSITAANNQYKIPVHGVEENIYVLDKNGNLVADNAVTKPTTDSIGGTSGVWAGAGGADVVLNAVAEEYVPIAPLSPAATTGAPAFNEGWTASNVAGTNVQNAVALARGSANIFETRVFGKNYNSYQSGATGEQTTANSYIARYNSKNKIGSARVTAATLQNVQYGRLTNNIDVLTRKPSDSDNPIVYRQFQEHGAPRSVDTYFYRGTNHTTLAQMDALKARGGSVQYYGHALTYGIGPKVPTQTTSANSLPTSYGLSSNEATIGNFVQAKYDISKGTVDGTIYNFINPNATDTAKADDFTRQDLVSFSGNVVGNTVIGTSTKLGVNETGSLTASFFGANANEIGGQVSSIQRSQGYTTPKWGAVFGATRGTTIENFNVIEQGQ